MGVSVQTLEALNTRRLALHGSTHGASRFASPLGRYSPILFQCPLFFLCVLTKLSLSIDKPIDEVNGNVT